MVEKKIFVYNIMDLKKNIKSLVQTKGALAVTGAAEFSYVYKRKKDETNGKTKSNVIGADTDIILTGSADLDNGFTINTGVIMDVVGSGSSSSNVTLDMGDMGSLNLGSAGGLEYRYVANDDVPSAYKEAMDDVDYGPLKAGFEVVDDVELKTDYIGYSPPFIDGLTVTANSSRVGITGSSNTSTGVLTTDTIGVGYTKGCLTVVYETGDLGYAGNDGSISEGDTSSFGVRYSRGPLTVGYQMNEQKTSAGGSALDADSEGFGLAYTVSDATTVSLAKRITDFEDPLMSDQEITAFGISYTVAPGMTLKASHTTIDNISGSANNDEESTQISLSLNF